MPTTSPGCTPSMIERLERFVGDDAGRRMTAGVAAARTIQPARRDDADAERQVARVDQMDSHIVPSPRAVVIRETVGRREAASEMSRVAARRHYDGPPLQF